MKATSFSPEAVRRIIGFHVATDPDFLQEHPGVTQQHVDSVLAGIEEPHETLLAALHLDDEP